MPASAQTQQAIESTYVHVASAQKGIEAHFVQRSSSTLTPLAALPGVGLLDALIIGAIAHGVDVATEERRKQAEAIAVSLQGSLDDYDFRGKVQEALGTRLAGNWLKLARLAWGSHFAFPEQLTNHASESSVLSLNVRYSLSADFRYLRLWCGAHLYPNSDSLRAIAARERPGEKVAYLYRNEVMHIGTFDGPRVPPAEAAARWGENGGARLRAVLDEAAVIVADLLAADLGAGGSVPTAGKRVSLEQNTIVTLLAESPGRALIRNANGTLWSVPPSLIGPAPPTNPLRGWD